MRISELKLNFPRFNAGSSKRWLLPQPIDLVPTLLYLGVLAFFLYQNKILLCGRVTHWSQEVLFGAAIGGLLLLDRIDYNTDSVAKRVRPIWGWAISLLALRFALTELIVQLDGTELSVFLYILLPFRVIFSLGEKVGYASAGFVFLLFFVKKSEKILNPQNPAMISNFAIYVLALIFVLTMARVVMQEKASRARTEELLAELELSQQRVAELATTKERNRLARDIHDSLGHYLTVINVQLEKALVFRARQPEEADQSVQEAKRLAREALLDVRRSVGALRNSDQPVRFSLATALTELVKNVRHSQLEIELTVQGDETGYPLQTLMTLYRVAQEGLTNVQKHAQASRVWLEVDFTANDCSLILRDNGVGFVPNLALGPADAVHAAGYGLCGLQERVELVGGVLQVQSKPAAGVLLLVHLPKDGLKTGVSRELAALSGARIGS